MSRFLRLCTYDRLLTTLLFVVIVVACGLTPMQTDTWWQLRAGQDMWQSGRVLLTDVYSHTAYGTFWLNHEWLAEVLFYAAYRAGGFAGITLFAAGLIVGGWAIVWRLARGPVRAKFGWFLVAIPTASMAWEPRPHAFSLLFMPAAVSLLVHRRVAWLPVVFALWANCHGGVLLGLWVLAAALGVETLLTPERWWKNAVLLAACAAAVSATPLGLSFWTEIPKSLARINQYPLQEWGRPLVTDVRMLPFWILSTLYLGSLVARWRTLKETPRPAPSEVEGPDAIIHAAALALLPLAWTGLRHVSPFLMLAAPALTRLVPLPASAGRRVRHRPLVHAAIAACALVAAAAMLASAYRNQVARLRWSPVSAPALAALRQCPENLYNRYDEGGSLIWFLPEKKVFLDGRQDPYLPELVREHIQMETAGLDPLPVFERYRIRCAYLPTFSPTASRLADVGWTTLYRDRDWIVLQQ